MTCKFGFAFIGLSGPLPCLVGLGSALRSGHCISWSFTDFGPCLEVLVVLFLAVVFQYRRISRPCLAGPGFADLGLLLGLSLENFGQFSATLLLRFLSSFLRSFRAFVVLFHLYFISVLSFFAGFYFSASVFIVLIFFFCGYKSCKL